MIRVLILMLSVALVGGSPAASQGILGAVQRGLAERLAATCAAMKADADRLKCFDKAVELYVQAAPMVDEPKLGSWSLTEEKAPLDDSPEVTATEASADGTERLIVRCREHTLEAAVMTRELFEFSAKYIQVDYRIGTSPPVSTSWFPSSNHTGAFARTPAEFLRELPDTGLLFIRLRRRDGTRVDGSFVLDGFAPARAKIVAACRLLAR